MGNDEEIDRFHILVSQMLGMLVDLDNGAAWDALDNNLDDVKAEAKQLGAWA